MVLKWDPSGQSGLGEEAQSLGFLSKVGGLTTPKVLGVEKTWLLLEWIETSPVSRDVLEASAADQLGRLHQVQAGSFGLDFPTRIGGLLQENPRLDSWPQFFAEARLLPMARRARDRGVLSSPTLHALEALASRLGELLRPDPTPRLIHGDLWSGNLLSDSNGVRAWIDPSPSFADREQELAFVRMFQTFGDDFFQRYQETLPIAPGFFEERAEILNLYPYLVHVCLFGRGYLSGVEGPLRRLGFLSR